MTAPRQVLPGSTILITRRCIGRMFLFRPSREANELFLYILAVAAERYDIDVHAYCVLSNHFHAVVTDRHGHLPLFEQYLDGLVARSFNAMHGRWESFWAPGSYSAVRLLTPEDVFDRIVYVLQNPTAAGLVRRGAEWPGLRTAPDELGRAVITVQRPKGFFRECGPLPPSATLRVVCPPDVDSPDRYRERLAKTVAELELRAVREVEAAGRSFLGPRRILAQRPTGCPVTHETRRDAIPTVASRDKWKRLEALSRLRGFLRAYRDAWAEFAGGNHRAVFPEGTYWMRICYGVGVAGFS